MATELNKIASIADQKKKVAAYKDFVDASITNASALQSIVEHVLNEDVQLVIARAVLAHFIQALERIDPEAHSWKTDLIKFTLQTIKPRIMSFEETDVVLREQLCEVLIEEEEYIEAAKTLAAINLESSARQYTDDQKAEKYVKIAELYLQEDETVDAENFINRASRVIHAVDSSNWALKLRYQVSYARILDSKRKFLDAALRYYEFSQSKPDEVDPEDLLQLLGKATTCAILAAAGPQRSRLLATLYKDERIKSMEHAPILEKLYLEQRLRRSDIAAFEESLLPHQKAKLANGFTVVEQSFLEHNMLAVSRIYTSMYFSELGTLLGVDAKKAEKVAATMIGEERMKGSIDQVNGLLELEQDGELLQNWDDRISSVCLNVNACAENIQTKYPQLFVQ
ncbi:COP9 signalosome complex subunit [Thraustotheca clavata]|uniref:COP9 signalosome complex subunit 4 n=1 Tax=Thraustotheca clavata TaxID=74557 RepID=A0A1V9ZVS7_9STRA|nr:COP9 signalosome complex subunit [Thraustotheca clavata]